MQIFLSTNESIAKSCYSKTTVLAEIVKVPDDVMRCNSKTQLILRQPQLMLILTFMILVFDQQRPVGCVSRVAGGSSMIEVGSISFHF
ncbi:unnamed protein product [Paramecium octaurelia]|uniref:Uncharacterized protein n=1 Tax=Paramecium octaurelia TaxID=43137 RepID=A0A8S1UJ49_PAROT|nr:unnamed protein product [Paramecium octaurelia]